MEWYKLIDFWRNTSGCLYDFFLEENVRESKIYVLYVKKINIIVSKVMKLVIEYFYKFAEGFTKRNYHAIFAH